MNKSKSIECLEKYNRGLVDVKGYIEFIDNKINEIEMAEIDKEKVKEIATAGWCKFLRFKESEKQGLRKLIKETGWSMADIFDKSDSTTQKQIVDLNILCQMVRNWLDYKQIYRFDVDTLEMLRQTKEELTDELLKGIRLPYNCFFIENQIEISDKEVETILVRVNDLPGGDREFSFYCFVKGDNYSYAYDNYRTKDGSFQDQVAKVEKDKQDFIKLMFKLLMYLAQPKVEILKKSSGIKERKASKSFYNTAYNENEVGYKLGNAIRKYKYVYLKTDNKDKDTRKSSFKKPHLRCGHFHHYWTGKGRTDLIVKYIEPTFIKGGADKPILHNVK